MATTAIFLINGLGIGAWAACIPALRQSLHLSDSALSLCLLAFSGGGIVGMPAASLLVARLGSQKTTMFLAIAFALAMAFPGYALSLPILIATAFVFGMGKGFLDVAMNTYAAAVQRSWGSAIMSSFHATFSVGGLVGSVAMGMLFAHGFDVRTGLLSMTAIALPLIGLAALLVRGAAVEGSDGNPASTFALPNRALLGIGCLCFLALLMEGGMADWSGVYMTTVVGVSTAGAAAGYAAFSVAMIIGRVFGDWAVHRWGERIVLRLGGTTAALGFVAALGPVNSASTIIGFALVGIGASNIVPLLFSAAARSETVAPSAAIAMTATVGYAGFLLGPPVIGFAADHIGLRAALVILLLAAVLIAGSAARVTGGRVNTGG
ncbi:MFS transporter [Rhizobium sp. FKL33]|uniref:MFS transporter n=1 Tax=Rhizobium sp. FKL33 TaxID=2562307 RepID=UPI0014851C4F|nr:MFS transporter [Rhizobium sp. FKL33]